MTDTTPNGIRVGHRVKMIDPALPNERGELLVVGIAFPDRPVLCTAAGEAISRDPNWWEVERVILPLPLTVQAGRHIIHAHKVRDGVYWVEVRDGGLAGFGGTVDEQYTDSFTTEKAAREYAYDMTVDLRDLAADDIIDAVTSS